MGENKIIKGNYELPQNQKAENKEPGNNEKPDDSSILEKQFELEALKKLKGSIAFVRKSGSPFVIRKGGKDGK